MSVVSAENILTWAKREAAQRNGPPRPYCGPYPDTSGPTVEFMDIVDGLACHIEKHGDQSK